MNVKKRWATPRIELGTSCTLSKNYTTKPSGQLIISLAILLLDYFKYFNINDYTPTQRRL